MITIDKTLKKLLFVLLSLPLFVEADYRDEYNRASATLIARTRCDAVLLSVKNDCVEVLQAYEARFQAATSSRDVKVRKAARSIFTDSQEDNDNYMSAQKSNQHLLAGTQNALIRLSNTCQDLHDKCFSHCNDSLQIYDQAIQEIQNGLEQERQIASESSGEESIGERTSRVQLVRQKENEMQTLIQAKEMYRNRFTPVCKEAGSTVANTNILVQAINLPLDAAKEVIQVPGKVIEGVIDIVEGI